jgi:DNA-binding MarR family transcriptional regulator
MVRTEKPDEAMVLAGEMRATLGLLKRRMREQAPPHDFTWAQISVLSLIEREGPVGISDLARKEGVRPQSMGETVAGMQSAGLVTGAPDPQDGRRTLWSLTPACREMIRASRSRREDWLAAIIREKLSPAEQKRLSEGVALLKRLGEALGESSADYRP